MADQDSIKAKLRALLAKTTAAGCTEPEAASAMAAAARIMAAHGIDPDDIDTVDGERVSIARSKASWPYSLVHGAIERVSRARSHIRYSHHAGGRLKITMHFTGRPSDVALAEYLYILLERAIRRAQADFRATKTWRLKRSRKTRGEEMAAFTEGLCWRLTDRVLEVFSHRLPPPPAPTQQPAVTPEPELTKAEQARARKQFRAWEKMINRKGYWAGTAAADAIQVTDAMAGEAPEPQMIGRS
ncbi:DUF7168 domain-containing protein [Zavarzinia aquatilis]|nr:DUF2786 domain-containing protein [Zavarzinia aquatilis]